MKKYFEIVGMIVLGLFSVFYTTKTTMVVKEMDNIMIKIKEEQDKYQINPVDAQINDDVIISGISGQKVDIGASYDAMKKIGTYNESMLVYENIKPSISVSNIYDKYFVGSNPNKKQVSLIFKIDNKDNIAKILSLLDKHNIKANFFTTEDLSKPILNLTNEGHNIGTITYENWLTTLIDKIANQKETYCYVEEKDKEKLDICKMNKSHTILPTIITKNIPTLTIKKNLKPGIIISMDVNKNLLNELEYIIRYIESKGYSIVTLEKLLEE